MRYRVVPKSHVRADDPQLFHVQVVDVEDPCNLQSPVERLEGRVAVKQFERQLQIVVEEELVRVAEEIFFARIGGRLERRGRRRHLPEFCDRHVRHRHVKKRVLTDDRIVALEHVLAIGVPARAARVRCVFLERIVRLEHAFVVRPEAVPDRKPVSPAVGNGDEVAVLLRFPGDDARTTRETDRHLPGLGEQQFLVPLRDRLFGRVGNDLRGRSIRRPTQRQRFEGPLHVTDTFG